MMLALISGQASNEEQQVRIFNQNTAFFNIYTGGAKAPPAPMLAPPLKGFGPPSNVPFCLKMSENHAEIAGNQV